MIPKNYFSSNETPVGANQGYPTEFQSGFPVGSTALPAMPPPYWGGTESSCSRRNDFKPVPQPKEFSSTYSLDALKNTWFLTTVVNGIPKRQTALANGFQLFSDTEYVDPISHLPTHHVIQLNCEEEIQIVMPAEDYDKGEYYKHFKSYIRKFPRCTKQQINNLIQYLLEGAAKYRLVLYPHPGFFRFRNGDLVFAGFPNDPRIPEQILPQSFKMRRIESVTNCPEQIIHEWARLHCSHPKLMLLGLTVIISLLLDFCEAIGVCSDFIITVRPSEKTSEEQLTALLCLQEYQLYPVPALESRAEVIRSYSASVWDAVAMYRDHSFIDESKGIDGTLRILLKDAGNYEKGRNIKVVLSRHAAYTARSISEGCTLPVSTDDITLDATPFYCHSIVKAMEAVLLTTILTRKAEVEAFFEAEKQRLREAELRSANLPEEYSRSAVNLFSIAANFLLKFMGVQTLTNSDVQALIQDLVQGKDLIRDADQAIVEDFSANLSRLLRSGGYQPIKKRQGMRIDPEAKFVISEGNRLFINGQTVNEVLAVMNTTHSKRSLLNALKHQELLSTTDGDTHPIQTYKLDGTPLRLYCYDFDGSILDADVLHRLQNLESDHFWLKSTEIPECDFVPLLTDAGNRTAGQLIQEKAAENMHHFICGQSGTGKSYLMCQLMAKYLTTGHRVIAFDSSESFSYEALCSNLSKQWVDTHVDFIDIEADGIPVDLFRINHSEKLSAQKTHLVDVLKAGVGELSSQQSNALRSVISDTLGLLGKDEQLRPDDLFAMLNEDSSTYASLRNRFEPLFEDINSLGMESQSWRTFFQQNDGKIIIIRTTSACTERSNQLIDMMLLTLFQAQRENPDVPVDIFIDEIQNQSFSEISPIRSIIKEGRKSLCAIFGATQDCYPRGSAIGDVMGKADTQIFLRPTLNSEGIVAAELRYRKADLARFDTMQRGDVIIKGPFYDREQGRNILTTLIGHVMPFIAAKN